MSETDITAAEAGRRLGVSRQWAVQLARGGAFDEGRDEEVRGLYEQIKACEAAIDTLRIVGYPELGKVEVTLLGKCPFVRYHDRALSAEEVAQRHAAWKAGHGEGTS